MKPKMSVIHESTVVEIAAYRPEDDPLGPAPPKPQPKPEQPKQQHPEAKQPQPKPEPEAEQQPKSLRADLSVFYRRRAEWLNQVNDDPAITGDMFRIAWAILQFVSSKSGEAYPGQVMLAEKAHVTDRTIRRALATLRERGHLTISHQHGSTRAASLKPQILSAEYIAAREAEDERQRRNERARWRRAMDKRISEIGY